METDTLDHEKLRAQAPDEWCSPKEVSDVLLAFPATVYGILIPTRDEIHDLIPSEFWAWHGNDYVALVDQWFAKGLCAATKFHMAVDPTDPTRTIDGELMMRHLQCVMGSYEPKHEHKIAAAAWLLALWTDAVEDWKK